MLFHLDGCQFVAPELNGGEAREVSKHLNNQLKVLLLNTVNINFEFIIFEKLLNQVHVLLNLLFVKSIPILGILIREVPDIFSCQASRSLFILLEFRVLVFENLNRPIP